jgi:hypothetical protein
VTSARQSVIEGQRDVFKRQLLIAIEGNFSRTQHSLTKMININSFSTI